MFKSSWTGEAQHLTEACKGVRLQATKAQSPRVKRANPREMVMAKPEERVPTSRYEAVCVSPCCPAHGSHGQTLCCCDLKLTWYPEHYLTDLGSGMTHAGSIYSRQSPGKLNCMVTATKNIANIIAWWRFNIGMIAVFRTCTACREFQRGCYTLE